MQVKTYRKCTQCGGTGEQYAGGGEDRSGPFPCLWPNCENGFLEIGYTECNPGLDDIYDKVEDVLDKCDDILEKLNE